MAAPADRHLLVERPDGIDHRLVPPGVADERGRALIRTLAAAIDETPPDALRHDWATCDARLLPAGVRGLGLQDLMFDGITEPIVRRFLANADALKSLAGSLPGIRFAIDLLGLSVRWRSWHAAVPRGPHDTYTARVYLDDILGEGEALAPRTRRAAITMIDAQKRWSQSGAETFALRDRAPMRMGAIVRARGRLRSAFRPLGDQRAATTLRIGAIGRARGRFRAA